MKYKVGDLVAIPVFVLETSQEMYIDGEIIAYRLGAPYPYLCIALKGDIRYDGWQRVSTYGDTFNTITNFSRSILNTYAFVFDEHEIIEYKKTLSLTELVTELGNEI